MYNLDDLKQLKNMGSSVVNNQPQPNVINPQIKTIMDMVRNSNMSAKDLFYQMAEQKGVDPESILKQLR